ncbi:MAG: hypothetical protein SF051_02985, partial [Elusimicrobiota bacterium]|nr:hypothetical protein [Elusimicrobiota bacterium]
MAAPAAKGGLGWAILAVALAIPGFLFYNWWTHLKAERQKAISQKARGRVPEGGVFSTPAPGAEKLVNPIAASTAAALAVSSGTAAPAAGAPEAGLVGDASAAPAAPAAASDALPDPAALLAG